MAKYDPLRVHLFSDDRPRIELGFAQVAEIVNGLPRSAYEHRAWWANEAGGNHVEAHAWLAAGYHVDHVDLVGQRVRFVRGGAP